MERTAGHKCKLKGLEDMFLCIPVLQRLSHLQEKEAWVRKWIPERWSSSAQPYDLEPITADSNDLDRKAGDSVFTSNKGKSSEMTEVSAQHNWVSDGGEGGRQDGIAAGIKSSSGLPWWRCV